MSLKKYLSAISPSSFGAVSETALYTPIATHILSGILNYAPKHYAINKSGAKGTPDIRIYSGEDISEWIVCEAKLHDTDIRKDRSRQRIWKEQVVDRGYIRAETVYVLLCAPRTFYVCGLDGAILDGIHIEDEELLDMKSGTHLPQTDVAFRSLLSRITYEASLERPQYEKFRRGELSSGYIQLTAETINNLHEVFDFSLRGLRAYGSQVFKQLKQEYQLVSSQLESLDQKLVDVGSDVKLQGLVKAHVRRLRRGHRLVLQLFEVDYPQFRHDQTYAGTKEESHFEDIFVTNTAYIALSRLFFVRICEDIGLTTRKISHEGPGLWQRFVDQMQGRYQDLIEVAYKDVAHIYSQLFEVSVFDWYGFGNGQLNDILERILFRLNAFSFKGINRDVLGSIYQYFRPKNERKRLGEYYTPEEVVDYILHQIGINDDHALMTKRILDPSCGSFTFGVRALLPLLKAGSHLSPSNQIELVRQCLIGYDINPFSVFLSHLSLLFTTLDIYLEAKKADKDYTIPGFNIQNRNSLTYITSQSQELYDVTGESADVDESVDYVVGNPPFVRNERLPAEDREVLNELFSTIKAGNTDLSVYFLHSAMKYWLKLGGVIGMVAPIGTANTKMAEQLRATLRDYTIFHIVSLEWMAKEVFSDADIIPMLIFARKERPSKNQTITVMTGLRHRAELKQAIENEKFFSAHASQLDYRKWLDLSPTGDWPLEVRAEDVPLLEKLNQQPKLETIARSSFAVKLGSKAKIVRPQDEEEIKESDVPFLTGQHICAFSLTDSDEIIDLSKISQADDASLWKDLRFYRENQGKIDESGLGRYDYKKEGLLNQNPSDTLCCFVSEIYVTLVAAVGDPLKACANNSVMVVTPFKYSAQVIASIINSRVSRYYSFLLLRSSILKRRRSTWYPRTLKNLPLPTLNDNQAARLQHLAVEADMISKGTQLNEVEAFLDLMSDIRGVTKAGFLNLRWTGGNSLLDRDDVAESKVENGELRIGSAVLSGEDMTLHLLRLALLGLDKEEIPVEEIQNMELPGDTTERARIAKETTGLSIKLEHTKERMKEINEEIDEIVAAGLGLSPGEHDVIRQRCQQFPLSVTVESPRYIWSPDRKRQARRFYQLGQRFK
jgi:predicted RNA methylase